MNIKNQIYMYCRDCSEPAAYSGNNSWKSTFYSLPTCRM